MSRAEAGLAWELETGEGVVRVGAGEVEVSRWGLGDHAGDPADEPAARGDGRRHADRLDRLDGDPRDVDLF